MKSNSCYSVIALLFLALGFAAYLWMTYAWLFESETAYLYNPDTHDIFEIDMTSELNPTHLWVVLNPLASIRRYDPGLVTYVGNLTEMRDRIRFYFSDDRKSREYSIHDPEKRFEIEYFIVHDQKRRRELVPDEWQGTIDNENRNDDEFMLVDAVIIEQEWPDGYMGRPIRPVHVSLVSDALIFFGHLAHELCVIEWTRNLPKAEAMVRETGCYFPSR